MLVVSFLETPSLFLMISAASAPNVASTSSGSTSSNQMSILQEDRTIASCLHFEYYKHTTPLDTYSVGLDSFASTFGFLAACTTFLFSWLFLLAAAGLLALATTVLGLAFTPESVFALETLLWCAFWDALSFSSCEGPFGSCWDALGLFVILLDSKVCWWDGSGERDRWYVNTFVLFFFMQTVFCQTWNLAKLSLEHCYHGGRDKRKKTKQLWHVLNKAYLL